MSGPTILEIFHLLGLLIFLASFAMVAAGKYAQHFHGQDLEYYPLAASIFPVILIIVVVRSYVFEPFNIPSESMFPLLTTGDVVYVNKSSYDVKFPLTNISVLKIKDPARGEVAVFKYPLNTKVFFIKRVIAVPGDEVVWDGDDVFINGEKIRREMSMPVRPDLGGSSYVRYSNEMLNGHSYQIRRLSTNDSSQFERTSSFVKLRTANTLLVNSEEFERHRDRLELKIPDGFFFVMGDNRDQSMDSREWGLVSRDNFVGQAKFNLMNFDKKQGFFWKISFNHSGAID